MANAVQLSNPVAVNRDTTNLTGDDAQDFRFGIGGLSQPSAGSTWGFAGGILPGASSSLVIDDCLVNPASPPSMNTILNPGNYAIPRIGQGIYLGAVSSGITLTHNVSNPSNPRVDYVIIRIRDAEIDPPTVAATAQVMILPGLPGAVPEPPTTQLTDGDLVLAAVTVRTGATTITSADIADARTFVTARGGIYPASGTDNRDGAYEGHYRDNQDTSALERWDGGEWQAVATPAAWTQFTPGLWSSAGAVSLGSGPDVVAVGRYQITGKMMTLRYHYYGVEPMDMGNGQIYTALPPGVVSAPFGETSILARLNTSPTPAIFMGFCYIPSNSTFMYLYFPVSPYVSTMGPYTGSSSSGGAGTGTPTITDSYPNPAVLVIQGSIEIG